MSVEELRRAAARRINSGSLEHRKGSEPMDIEWELRIAAESLRAGDDIDADNLREPLADLLDAIADISRGLRSEPYEGTWQGRGLRVARAINPMEVRR